MDLFNTKTPPELGDIKIKRRIAIWPRNVEGSVKMFRFYYVYHVYGAIIVDTGSKRITFNNWFKIGESWLKR